MPPKDHVATAAADWQCKSCTNQAGKPWRNKGALKECSKCHLHKGACFGQKVSRSTAESPSTSAKAAKAPDYKQVYEAQLVENQRIQKERKNMALQLVAKAPGGPEQAPPLSGDDADDCKAMVADEPSNGPAALEAAVAEARDELKQMEGFSEFNRSLIIDFPAKLAAAKAKLETATANRRAANPLKQRLEGAEAHQARSAKKLTSAKAALATKQQELVSLQEAIKVQAAAVDTVAAVVAKADAEVAVLAAQLAAERSTAVDAAPGTPVQALVHAQSPGGDDYVSIAEATQMWAEAMARINQEREHEREQLNNLLDDARLQSQAPSEAAPSEANDTGTVDELVDDDEAWNKVEKSKRKAYLDRGRDRLAKDVRSRLCNFTKVSDTSSPFKKPKM